MEDDLKYFVCGDISKGTKCTSKEAKVVNGYVACKVCGKVTGLKVANSTASTTTSTKCRVTVSIESERHCNIARVTIEPKQSSYSSMPSWRVNEPVMVTRTPIVAVTHGTANVAVIHRTPIAVVTHRSPIFAVTHRTTNDFARIVANEHLYGLYGPFSPNYYNH